MNAIDAEKREESKNKIKITKSTNKNNISRKKETAQKSSRINIFQRKLMQSTQKNERNPKIISKTPKNTKKHQKTPKNTKKI